jgi:6-phosphogluconolactonase (cycloisomerase 2 family)
MGWKPKSLVSIAGALALMLLLAAQAAAAPRKVVFVQTDNPAGNQVVAYQRAANGTLTEAGSYATGGLGGQLEGSTVDHTSSQGALGFDSRNDLLVAVNAGSNTISVFAVYGDRLGLLQVLPSGGTFPVSVATGNGLIYVLNALDGGAVQGFAVIGGRLQPIATASRSLGLASGETPQFTHTPGQVALTPDGSQLVVTTKANGNNIDVFNVGPSGELSAPTVNNIPGGLPFGVVFDRWGHLLVAETGLGALADYGVRADGELEQFDLVPTEQAATCWVVQVGARRFFTSNAGSASLTGFEESIRGLLLTRFSQTSTDAGTVDASASSDARYLYVQTGAAGIVDEFEVDPAGALTPIGSVTVPGAAGGEGIQAF